MTSRVQKWGNSLALRIPKSLATEAGLTEDSSVELSVCEGKLIVTPCAKLPTSLAALLAHVTKKNLHHEVDTGSVLRGEAW